MDTVCMRTPETLLPLKERKEKEQMQVQAKKHVGVFIHVSLRVKSKVSLRHPFTTDTVFQV